MKQIIWLLLLGALGTLGYGIWVWRRNWLERKRAAEERFASFMVQAKPGPTAPAAAASPAAPTAPTAPAAVPQQRLLFEAAAKAAEAGEPTLSIQLYARLLSRYPETAFGAQARAAVEVQKKKLAKP